MACDEGLIHALFDGELSAPQQAAVRLHLRGCSACRQVQKELNWLHKTLTEAPRRRSWRPLLTAAAVFALAFLGWRAWTPAPLPPPTTNSSYEISLNGQTHQIKVEGAELVELSLGEQNVDLRKAKIE